MKWVRFEQEGRISFGILSGDMVQPVEGSPFETYAPSGRSVALSGVRLLTPFVPRVFYAVGYNYAGHVSEADGFMAKPIKTPKKPDVGYRSVGALIATDEAIVIPPGSSGAVQFEGELVAIVGKTARNLREDEVLDCLLGYTIGNDVSERSWQSNDRTTWRAKNADTFKPMGPCIETELDLDRLTTRVRLNGQQVSEFPTNRMIFGVQAYLAEISRAITLQPGDMIWMGTEAPTLDMRDGDTVEIEIDAIGTLRNHIVASANQ